MGYRGFGRRDSAQEKRPSSSVSGPAKACVGAKRGHPDSVAVAGRACERAGPLRKPAPVLAAPFKTDRLQGPPRTGTRLLFSQTQTWGARRAAERFRVKRVGGDGKTNQPTDQLTLRVSSPHGDYDGGWPGHSKGVPQREMAQLPIDNTSGPSRIPGRECGCLAPSRVEDKVWDPCVQGDPWGDTERASGHTSRNARLDPQARQDTKKMLTVSLKEGDSGWQCVGAAVPPLRPGGWRGPWQGPALSWRVSGSSEAAHRKAGRFGPRPLLGTGQEGEKGGRLFKSETGLLVGVAGPRVSCCVGRLAPAPQKPTRV